MKKAKIIDGKIRSRSFVTTTQNTGISQRETLRGIIVNLSTCLGIKEIHKKLSAREAIFYEPQGPTKMTHQSATNTILELSELLLKKCT